MTSNCGRPRARRRTRSPQWRAPARARRDCVACGAADRERVGPSVDVGGCEAATRDGNDAPSRRRRRRGNSGRIRTVRPDGSSCLNFLLLVLLLPVIVGERASRLCSAESVVVVVVVVCSLAGDSFSEGTRCCRVHRYRPPPPSQREEEISPPMTPSQSGRHSGP